MILIDTREQKYEHVRKAFEEMGVPYDRTKLYVGDYTLVNDQSVCVDRKAGLHEVYSNLIQEHDRFRAECKRAKEAEIRLVVLIEEEAVESLDDVPFWQNPRAMKWAFIHSAHQAGKLQDVRLPAKPPVGSDRLAAIMKAMELKYGVEWRFVSRRNAGREIVRILTRKELY